MSRAIVEAIPSARWIDGMCMHVTAWHARLMFPEHRMFTILRNPWDCFASQYALVQRWVAEQWDARTGSHQSHIEAQASLSFADFVAKKIDDEDGVVDGGFSVMYANPQCDVDVYRFEDHPYTAIGESLGVRLNMRHENRGEYRSKPIEWTGDLIEKIAKFCHRDIELFGYTPPQEGACRKV